MAQEQKTIQIAAPGFWGINTQSSPIDQPAAFASIADNCVIDKYGRVASRKGFQWYTENPEILSGPIVVTQEFITKAGDQYLFNAGDNKLWYQRLTSPYDLVELTLPVDYTITDNDWKIVGFNDQCFFVQAGHPPLIFDPAVSTTSLALAPLPAGAATIGYPNECTAGFGYLWYGDWDSDSSIVFWSDLLSGDSWADTSSGSIDLTLHWPSGYDRLIAMTAHNNFMVFFGQQSILLYNIPDDGPVYTSLTDTIEGIGCVARDSLAFTGKDLVFLDSTGVRLLSRTIQEKSIPLGDVSLNVRTDVKTAIRQTDVRNIRSVYNPDDSFYAIFFPDISTTWVFDTRYPLENGSWRATRWPTTYIYCAGRGPGGTTWFGGDGGLYVYQGADDKQLDTSDNNNELKIPVSMKYYTQPMTFDSPANLKFPKQVDMTFIGSTALTVYLYWAYDYSNTFNNTYFVRESDAETGAAYYNINEYDDAEYSQYGLEESVLSIEHFNVWGNGRNVKFGFEASVTDVVLSMQELNIQALLGRII